MRVGGFSLSRICIVRIFHSMFECIKVMSISINSKSVEIDRGRVFTSREAIKSSWNSILIPARLGGWLQPLRFVSSLEVHLGKALQTVGALFLKNLLSLRKHSIAGPFDQGLT